MNSQQETTDAPAHVQSRGQWALALLLVLATFAAYEQVRHAGFIWDDDAHLTQNPCIVGPLGLSDIWTSRAARHFPLVLTTFWAEHAVWGLNPLWYHLFNVLMHAACAIALWRVLLGLRVRGAFLGAALWALHPVQVETVAWITELKNTQSCLFYLLSVLFFVRWVSGERTGARPRDYAAALVFAALAMASKSSTVVLPVVLGLCAWWMRGSFRLRDAARVAPVMFMSVAVGVLALWTQHLEGANEPQWSRGLPERLATAGRVFWFYLGKLAWPHPLIFVYPRWNIEWAQAAAYGPLVAMCVFMLALWWFRAGRLRPAFFAAAYFLIALGPVLGLLDQFFLRYSFVGDHFQYLASMGPLALAGAGISAAFALMGRTGRVLKPFACAALLSALGLLSWRQSAVYRDDEALWKTTVALNPACWMGHNNLGAYYLKSGRNGEAIGEFEMALAINANDSNAHQNLATALAKTGRVDDAIVHYQGALKIAPALDVAYNGLGEALVRKGRIADAMGKFQQAIRINPDFELAERNYGDALLRTGNPSEAIIHYRRALEISPRDIQARTDLGSALLTMDRADEAAAEFGRALAINPRFISALINASSAELKRGRWQAAAALSGKALEIAPNTVEAHNNLAAALLEEGRWDEAIAHCRRALEIDPAYRQARMNLSEALLKEGRGDEAKAQLLEATRAR